MVTLVEWCTGCNRFFASSWWVQPSGDRALDSKIAKKDSNAVIHRVRMKPLHKSRFSIPLCRLRCLPLVRPINKVDVAQLENEFVMGYCDGDWALYVFPYYNLNEVRDVSNDIHNSWSSLWQEAMRNSTPCSKMTLTLLTFLARCSTCRRGTTVCRLGGGTLINIIC